MTQEELNKVVENHGHWLREDCKGWINMRADLRGAVLRGADLRDADLRDADLKGAKNVPFVPYACPDFGMFIGFKKVYKHVKIGGYDYYESNVPYIVVLEIPEEAKRLSATGRKCRCDKAKVLAIQNINGTSAEDAEVCSAHEPSFIYHVGEMVYPDSFDEDRWNECSHGIHFFINRQEAVNY